jgi:hypothetical protein
MKKILYILSIAVASSFLSSCETESEISFLEISEDLGFVFTGSQGDIEDFLGTDTYNIMLSLGLDINPGSTPLSLTGSFRADPYCRAASTNPDSTIGCVLNPFQITFSNQDNDNLTISYQAVQFNSDGSIGFEETGSGFISGDPSGDFTVIVRATSGDGSVNATAFSGRVTTAGIVGYQDIFVQDIDSNDQQGALFNDEDGLAERQ